MMMGPLILVISLVFSFPVAYAVALVLCGMDFYVFAYFVSFHFNERGTSMLLIGMAVIFGNYRFHVSTD